MTESRVPWLARHVTVGNVVALVSIGLAVHLLLPEVGGARRSADALSDASLPWLLAAVAAFVASVAGGGAALLGATVLPLAPRRTTEVAFAASAIGHLSPGGLAGMRVLQRHLERAGAGQDGAIGAVALVQVVGIVVDAVALIVAIVAVGTSDLDPVRVPDGWIVLLVIVVVLLGAGSLLHSRLGRERFLTPLRAAARSAVVVLRRPARAGLLAGGSIAQTAALALALASCLEAFHARAPLAHVLATYVVATVIGTLSPTPGGVGAFEAAAVAGLTGLGVPAASAVPGVLAFRLITFWLPIPVGAALVAVLRHDHEV
jgi:undecaprenyl-diphosphatase